MSYTPVIVIIVSADSEWEALKEYIPVSENRIRVSPYGEYFRTSKSIFSGLENDEILFHGGWGKIDSAASAQWAISEFHPDLVIHIGTAGGFSDRIKEEQIVFATKTIVYDITERMHDPEEAIHDYITEITTPVPPEIVEDVFAPPSFPPIRIWIREGLIFCPVTTMQ